MTSLSAPAVDYRDTSRRPAWSELPGPVRDAVGRLAGGPVVRATRPSAAGSPASYAGRRHHLGERPARLREGRRSRRSRTWSRPWRRRRGPRGPAERHPGPAARWDSTSVDGWSVLVIEVVAGRMPGQPWTPEEVDASHRACLRDGRGGHPVLGRRPGLGRALSTDADILAVGRSLADGSFVGGHELPAWLPGTRRRVGELVLGAEGRFDGRDPLPRRPAAGQPPRHVVADGPASATVVDWNWVGAAAGWVDWVGLLPLMAAQGIDTDALAGVVAAHPRRGPGVGGRLPGDHRRIHARWVPRRAAAGVHARPEAAPAADGAPVPGVPARGGGARTGRAELATIERTRTARVGPWQSERSTGYAPPLAGCWAAPAAAGRRPRALGPRRPRDARPPTGARRHRTGTGATPGDFRGIPAVAYAPKPDGQPDPGEIVWTWVPFEEDNSVGKDRPVLLVGSDGDWLLARDADEQGPRPRRPPAASAPAASGSTSAPVGGTGAADPARFG